jgi:hypothetical protein
MNLAINVVAFLALLIGLGELLYLPFWRLELCMVNPQVVFPTKPM